MEDEKVEFGEKMKKIFFNFNKFCFDQGYNNIDFLNGCLNCILVLYTEQANESERTHFKNHVFKILFEYFGEIEKSKKSKENVDI